LGWYSELEKASKEKELYDHAANLFSIIPNIKEVEVAFSFNRIPPETFRKECAKLIEQFNTAREFANMQSNEDLKNFMADYDLQCKMAYRRLVETGVPSEDDGGRRAVVEITQYFITFKDALDLNEVAVDQLFPLLKELVDSFKKSKAQFEGKENCIKWLETLTKMRASDTLNEDQVRQLKMDLETAYGNFYKSLG